MKRRAYTYIAFVTALIAILASSQAGAALISQSSELQMGRDAARQIESRYRVSSDRAANALVQSMGRRLASMSSRPNIPWQFKVLETGDVNAVSVPGYVYVFRGLLNFVGNDRDALAGVVGHEIGHTAARHAVKAAEQQLKYDLALQLLFKGRGARQLGSLAANLALAGYGRSEEYEADRLGLDYMARAGYDPNGMVRFFRKLQQQEGRQPGGLATYFRTHPPTGDRIARVEQQMASRG
jgi:beta-barrel assembly-enhancing protease